MEKSKHTKANYALYKHLIAHIKFLKYIVNEHVSLTKNSNPSLVLQFDKVVHVSGIDTTRTKWDN